MSEPAFGQKLQRSSIGAVLVVVGLILLGRLQGVSGGWVLSITAGIAILGLVLGARRGRMVLLPLTYALLALASSLWSDQPRETVGLASVLVVTLVLGSVIAANLDFDRFLAIVDWTLRVLIFISVILGVFVPLVGLTQRYLNYGSLRGVYEHRNGLAFIIALAIVTTLVRRWGRFDILSLLCVLMYLAALQWTGSAGGLILAISAVVIFVLIRMLASWAPRTRTPGTLLVGTLLLILGLLGRGLVPPTLGLIDRESSFVSRVHIWQAGLEAWSQKSWLGYGWGNILGDSGYAAASLNDAAGYDVRSTHNGYLAMALQLGIIGLCISVLLLSMLIYQTARNATFAHTRQATWSLLVIIMLCAGDWIETRAFTNIGWFLICLIAQYNAPKRAAG